MKTALIIFLVGLVAFLAQADHDNSQDSDLDRAGTIWIGRPPYSGGYGNRPHRPKPSYGHGGGGYGGGGYGGGGHGGGGYGGGGHGGWGHGHKPQHWSKPRPCYGYGCGGHRPHRQNERYNDWGHTLLGKPGGNWIPGR